MMAGDDVLQFRKGAIWTYKRWKGKTVSLVAMGPLFQKIQIVHWLAVGQQRILPPTWFVERIIWKTIRRYAQQNFSKMFIMLTN
jgi:hypothetical protein